MGEFLTDVKTLRERARQEIEKGPITDAYGADRQRVIQVLNEALATELVCILRYKRHYFTAQGMNASNAAAEFLQHANDETGHADQLAGRITQLQGEPDFNPDTLTHRSHAEYVAGNTLEEMVKEDLVAERVARVLQRDHPLARQRRSRHPPHARRHPRRRRRARRGHAQPPAGARLSDVSIRPRPNASMRPQRPGMSSNSR
jgi:bacterioferritin